MIYPLAHICLFLIEWLLLGLSIRLCYQSISIAMIILPIVLASISYDNLILAIGSFIGEGKLLENLSMIRYLLHFFSIPLLIIVGVEIAQHAGIAWINKKWRVFSWIITIVLIGVDITNNFISLNLVPVRFMGILRYVSANPVSPPIITILVGIFVLLIGINLWTQLQWKWLFLGTLISLIGNAIPTSLVGTIVGSTSEFLMVISLFLTEDRIQRFKYAMNRSLK